MIVPATGMRRIAPRTTRPAMTIARSPRNQRRWSSCARVREPATSEPTAWKIEIIPYTFVRIAKTPSAASSGTPTTYGTR